MLASRMRGALRTLVIVPGLTAPLGRLLRGRAVPFLENPGAPGPSEARLLLISYHFPPAQTVGALRWEKFSDYAAERGWAMDVVTLDPASLKAPDRRRLAALPPGIRVYGVP